MNAVEVTADRNVSPRASHDHWPRTRGNDLGSRKAANSNYLVVGALVLLSRLSQ